MSYNIQEGVEDARKQLRAEEAIAERYPDATLDSLPDGRRVWVSPNAAKDATSFDLVHGKEGPVVLCPYIEVEGMRVYTDHWKWQHAITLLHDVQKRHPKLHGELLSIILKR